MANTGFVEFEKNHYLPRIIASRLLDGFEGKLGMFRKAEVLEKMHPFRTSTFQNISNFSNPFSKSSYDPWKIMKNITFSNSTNPGVPTIISQTLSYNMIGI